MRKVTRLTESELNRIVKKIINEDIEMMDVSSDSDHYKKKRRKIEIPFDEVARLYQLARKFCDGRRLPDCVEIESLARQYDLNFG
jgi:hypothetical protein